jgi:hypothetical protein
MATDVTIGGEGTLFVGEDKTLELHVKDSSGVPVNISGWSILFDVRTKDNAADPAIVSATAAITGTYDAVVASNTQRARVVLTDDQLNLFKGSNLVSGAKTYRLSWKRTDPGLETVLCRGDFAPEKATAP